MTPCISPVFIESFMKDRLYELSPEGSKVVDLSPDNFFKLTSVMKWSNKHKESTREDTKTMDDTLIGEVANAYLEYEREPAVLDKFWPPIKYNKATPARFALIHLLRELVINAKKFMVKKGDGRDLCHASLGAAYGSIAALDKHWKRRVESLPQPNELARIYFAGQLDELVADLEEVARRVAKLKAEGAPIPPRI